MKEFPIFCTYCMNSYNAINISWSAESTLWWIQWRKKTSNDSRGKFVKKLRCCVGGEYNKL